MHLLVTTLRWLFIIALLVIVGAFSHDYYQAKAVGLPRMMTLWDRQYKSIKVELQNVTDSTVRFQRLEDGRYYTVEFADLSFLSSQRVQLFKNSQTINGTTAATRDIARLQSERKELLQRIDYFEARAEQTTSSVETRTLNRDVKRLSADLLVVERRLKESGVELDYTTSSSRNPTSGIQSMGTRLIKFGSNISEKLR